MTKAVTMTIATKHPLYGVYAYNLAVSLRAIDPVMPISVIADQVGLSMLDDYQKTVFDRIITPDLCVLLRWGEVYTTDIEVSPA